MNELEICKQRRIKKYEDAESIRDERGAVRGILTVPRPPWAQKLADYCNWPGNVEHAASSGMRPPLTPYLIPEAMMPVVRSGVSALAQNNLTPSSKFLLFERMRILYQTSNSICTKQTAIMKLRHLIKMRCNGAYIKAKMILTNELVIAQVADIYNASDDNLYAIHRCLMHKKWLKSVHVKQVEKL